MPRVLDLLILIPLALAAGPFLALVAIAVRLQLGSPVIFRQLRSGHAGRTFVLYKFRTMADLRDPEGRLLADHQRLTRFGRLLRRTSLDELPELWNVLVGDMSLVGPRPLLPEYLPRYTRWQYRRHEVKPGLTGWAQVNGRNSLSWSEKFELDIWYVDHRSLWLDLKILALTLAALLRRDGIAHGTHATMPEFMGDA